MGAPVAAHKLMIGIFHASAACMNLLGCPLIFLPYWWLRQQWGQQRRLRERLRQQGQRAERVRRRHR